MILRAYGISIVTAAILLAASVVEAKPKSAPKELREIPQIFVDSQSVLNRVVYLDFFASWCAPCGLSIPFMKELNREYADSGLQIIGVCLDKDSTEANDFLERMRPPFRIVRDPEGKLAKQFDLKAVPSSYFYGREGGLREMHQGFVPADTSTIRLKIRSLLKERKQP